MADAGNGHKRIAMVAGIGHYIHYDALEFCPPSAKDVYELLVSSQYGNCDPRLSTLTMITENQTLSASGLDDILIQTLKNINLGDQFVFYFCGHGKIYRNDLFLLLPESQKDTRLFDYNFRNLLIKLKDSGITKAIVIVDACHSGAMFNSIKEFKELMDDWKPELPKGFGFMAASGKFQYAWQKSELRRTIFSHVLCEGLKHWKNPYSPYVTLLELKEHINAAIKQQHPETEQTAHIMIQEGADTLWFSLNPAYVPASRFLNEEIASTPSSFKRFPFTNQDEQIKIILSPLTSSYHLVDAPSGYGKTALLQELQQRFQEQFLCTYLSTNDCGTLQSLIMTIFKNFGHNQPVNYEKPKLLIDRLGSVLKQKREDTKKKGIVLLIDFENTTYLNFFSELLELFIPRLQRSLISDNFFCSKASSFRVVIAGCYLAGSKKILSSNLPFKVHTLHLFSYETLLELACSYLRNPSEDVVRTISSYIMRLSGGHPGFTATLLEEYRKDSPSPDDFLEFYKDKFQRVFDQTIKNIRENIPSALFDVMVCLSPCRRFNCKFLSQFIQKGLLQEKDEYVLADKLTNANLIVLKKDGFFQDDITRRILAIWLYQTKPQTFFEISQAAKEIYTTALSNPITKYRETIAIELLYQELQLKHYQQQEQNVENKNKDSVDTFLDALDNCLKLLINDIESFNIFIAALNEALEKDWEFKFVMNCLLSKKENYTEQLYPIITQRVCEFRQSLRKGESND